ncbi:MAG: C10 family peptidase [Muribaculaceae bacterium]|nr:C10 family peptidase [Muribaculaceae bacterium]
MKKIFKFLTLLLYVGLCGCSNVDQPPVMVTEPILPNHFISQDEAKEIALRIFGADRQTRGEEDPIISYVINDKKTRSVSDTVAYVLNYQGEKGFAIISADNRVYPVLAYSDTGSFSFENEIVMDNFVSKIAEYIGQADPTTEYSVSESDFETCVVVPPMVQTTLHQRMPWSKYVVKEHPDCPVGCVAVAAALSMSHSKQTLTYHGSVFDMKSIVNAIYKKQNPNPEEGYDENDFETIYTYEQAVDSMAKLLYWIGKDVNMSYKPDGSGAFSDDAFKLIKKLNYTVSNGFSDFDINKVVGYLSKGKIVYLKGADQSSTGRHAWVADGCSYCKSPKGEILNPYIHCDWGWGGACNGSFSGNVFDIGYYGQYKPDGFFAVGDISIFGSPDF